LNEDFLDILRALSDTGARFLIVGAHALAGHGYPRATGDLDVWVELSEDNAGRVWKALLRFGAPIESLQLSADDFLVPGTVIQLGVPPRRIDLLTSITAVEFPAAWDARIEIEIENMRVPMLGREHLLINKLAVGRPQDLADSALLRAADDESGSQD
jgi:hypothetical protein